MQILLSDVADDDRVWFTVAFDRRIGADTEAYRWLINYMKHGVYEPIDGPNEIGKYHYVVEVSGEVIEQMKEAYEACFSRSITRH